ncbi:MAG: dethiobiotin synthase [Pseudomonadota bacterium]
MSLKLFITGTDTGIGKTYISIGLLNAFQQLGYSTIGFKPIAAGAVKKNNILCNQDAIDLNTASSIKLDYHHTNPIVFEPFISPNIAATQAGVKLSLNELISKSQHTINYPCDILLTEGAGGWLQPLNESEALMDFVSYHQMKIILVVGIRLGCINHALLTYQSIKQTHLPIVGWLANCFEINELEPAGVINTLQQWLEVPYLGMVPHQKKPEEYLQMNQLLHQCSITG